MTRASPALLLSSSPPLLFSALPFPSLLTTRDGAFLLSAGQSIFLEIMSEMKDTTEFPKACTASYIFMLFAYGLTALVAYGIVGNDVEGFLPDSLPENALKQAVGVFITFHSHPARVELALFRSMHTAHADRKIDSSTLAGRARPLA